MHALKNSSINASAAIRNEHTFLAFFDFFDLNDCEFWLLVNKEIKENLDLDLAVAPTGCDSGPSPEPCCLLGVAICDVTQIWSLYKHPVNLLEN